MRILKTLLAVITLTAGALLIRKSQTISPHFNGPTVASSRPLRSQAVDIRFSPDSKRFMVAEVIGKGEIGKYSNGENFFGFEGRNKGKRIGIWNVAQQREIESLKAELIFNSSYEDFLFLMPDFKTLITRWGGSNFKVKDIRRRVPDKKIEVRSGYISDAEISPDGKVLVLGMNGQVQFFDAKTYRFLRRYIHGGRSTRVNFGPNSDIVRCTWYGMKPHFVNVESGKRIASPSSTPDYEVIWSPDKKWFAQKVGQSAIELWKSDGNKNRKLKTFNSTLVTIENIQFSPNGKWLAVGGLSSTEIPVEFFKIP